jgi:hypothetical protein
MKQNFQIFVYKEGFKPLVHAAKTTGTYASEGLFLERMENEQTGFTVSDPALATIFFLPYSVRQMVEYLMLKLLLPSTHSGTVLAGDTTFLHLVTIGYAF